MKIKLAFLDNDANYLHRLTSNLCAKFGEKFALYSFTSPDTALSALSEEKINVFIADHSFSIDAAAIPKGCGFACFVDSPDITSIHGQRAVCKFQKIDLLYKQILSIYSDALGNVSMRNAHNNAAGVVAFSSPCGGMGTSTAAAACAVHFALAGQKTLYLNLESFGGSDSYFCGEGAFDMSDVIYAVKSRKGNLPIKLESCARRDAHGVSFFMSSKIALDMLELTADEKNNLLSALAESGNYDYIVMDMDFGLDKDTLSLFRQAQALVWVCDGMPESSFKTARACASLKMLEGGEQNALADRISLLYNKSQQGRVMPDLGIPVIGSLPKLRHKTGESILDRLAPDMVFDRIAV